MRKNSLHHFMFKRVPKQKILMSIFCLNLLLVHTGYSYAQESIKASLSSYASEGDYGFDSKTFTLATQAGIKYRNDQWSIGVSQPYVYQDGPAEFAFLEQGESGETFVVVEEQQKTRSGYADPSVTVNYSWPKKSRTGYWTVSERWKIPTADEKQGFSSGRHEHTLSISRNFRMKRWMIHGKIGRHFRQYGKNSDNKARSQISLGGMYFLSRRIGLGFSVYNKTATENQEEDVRSLNLDMRVRLDRQWQLGIGAGKGLSSSASDQYAGLNLSYRWKLSR